jgi:hypothetical protein
LKKIDIFSVPVKTFIHRRSQDMKTTSYHENLGSYFGGLMTLLFLMLMFFYSFTLVDQMVHGENDIVNKMVMTNSFTEDTKSVDLNNVIFMPYLIMKQQNYNSSLTDFDIFEKDPHTDKERFSLGKISNYIEFNLHFSSLNEDETKTDIYYPFRNCKQRDFTE